MVNTVMLNAAMLNAIMLNAVMLNAVMPNTVMLSVIMLNVVAPSKMVQAQENSKSSRRQFYETLYACNLTHVVNSVSYYDPNLRL